MSLPPESKLDEHLQQLGLKSGEIEMVVEEMFKEADKDNSGQIDVSELKSLLTEVRKKLSSPGEMPAKEEMDEMVKSAMKDLDKDGSGQLDVKEFAFLAKLFMFLGSQT
eukprot:CAMPEP_0184485688 /NCGR_PEP_ID=MMETSP0113_2-20130426/7263_1 /TAXON_ID=91329 /ORGANISM="Norrisiella sphaerica, Strain BC52" /LENGTH=108 /DNA_ID=CAMNT_0026867243 /DNA_START=18 /DNA_END=344 /DNA_ORIENTATION=-